MNFSRQGFGRLFSALIKILRYTERVPFSADPLISMRISKNINKNFSARWLQNKITVVKILKS